MTAVLTSRVRQRACYAALDRYDPMSDASLVSVDLSDNTNRWGMPPAAARAVRSAAASMFTRYPEAYSTTLKSALARYVDADPAMIVTGCGSDDVLDAAVRAFCGPGECLAFAAPSFEMIPRLALMNGVESRAVPLTEAYDLDVAAIQATGAALTYVCSPNNPTGTPMSRVALESLVRAARGVVLIDEAYAEYADSNALDLARTQPHVLVVRTFSKAFGLAGMRVGYAIGNPALVAEVEKARGPFKVSAIGAAAAMAAVSDEEGLGWVREHVALVRSNCRRAIGALAERGLDVPASESNFVFCPIARADAIARGMRARGIAVRAFGNLPAVSDALRRSGGSALRLTIGPWDEVEAALTAFDAARSECA